MSRYTIRGDYSIKTPTSKKKNNNIMVKIPFTAENGTLLYGIDRALSDLTRNGIFPSETGFDILSLAALVYLADTRISRLRHSQNSWTREIVINLPVNNIALWEELSDDLSRMLNFLTGDRWTIVFSKRVKKFAENQRLLNMNDTYDAVSLFSGGMDSLINTINHLEHKHKIALISHAGDGYTKKAQQKLMSEFKNNYPNNQLNYFNLWMVFDKNIVLDGGIDNTTRSRSFLFIAFGLFALSGIQGVNVLQVPENGLISLNVPLDDLRIGPHSTRTTHPFYMNLWNVVIKKLGLSLSVELSKFCGSSLGLAAGRFICVAYFLPI